MDQLASKPVAAEGVSGASVVSAPAAAAAEANAMDANSTQVPAQTQDQGEGAVNGELTIFSFHLSELSEYQVTSPLQQPFRARLAHALCEAFGINYMTKAERLASRSDLGQLHADSYLGFLQIASDLWTFDSDQKKKKPKSELDALQERFSVFNLGLPNSKDPNATFSGMFAYLRLVSTGSLAAAQNIIDKKSNVAINWYGGHARARKARAHNGDFVNDSVLACLSFVQHFERILHVSVGIDPADGVEEAFYTSSRVFTVSFHDSRVTTSVDADIGHGEGQGYTLNIPLDKACFNDDDFLQFFEEQLRKIVQFYQPFVIVFSAAPSVIGASVDDDFKISLRGFVRLHEIVRSMGPPTLILGGPSPVIDVSAKAWCATTGALVGKDVIGKPIPPDFPYREHFAIGDYTLDLDKRQPIPQLPKVDMTDHLNQRDNYVTERLNFFMQEGGVV